MTVRNADPSGQRDETRESGEPEPRASHFSPRTGLIGLSAVFFAVLAGALTYVGHRALAPAVVTGALTLACAFVFFDKIIGD